MLQLFIILLSLLLFINVVMAGAQSEQPGIYRVAAAGNYYAAAYFDRTIRVWDATTQQLLFTFLDTTVEREIPLSWASNSIEEIAFSPDSNLLAASFCGYYGGMIRIFDITNGNMVNELAAWSCSGDIAWKPDGTQLAALAEEGMWSNMFSRLMVWEVTNWKLVTDQDADAVATSIAIAWNPDGSNLVTFKGESAYLWDTATWSQQPNAVFPEVIIDAAWSTDGNQIAGVTAFGTVYIADVAKGSIATTLPGTSTREYIRQVEWSADNQLAATNTNQILVWDAATGILLATIEAPNVTDVVWLSEGQLLYGGGDITTPEIVTLPIPIATVTLTPTSGK